MTLLQEAYKSRDKIALIAFSGHEANVVVPPTKSVALTRRRLESMPCGSQTPLADALVKAVRIGINAIKVKQDTGKVALVLISDCRPNVPLCLSEGEPFDASLDLQSTDGQPSRKYLRDEVVAIGKQIGAMNDFDLLCIDTEDKFVHTGVAQELARVAGGNYHALARADHQSISRAVSEATTV
jgi:magnesium chelatase subunit D